MNIRHKRRNAQLSTNPTLVFLLGRKEGRLNYKQEEKNKEEVKLKKRKREKQESKIVQQLVEK